MKLYRIYLPKRYNDGKEVKQEKIRKIAEEIREKFGGYSLNKPSNLPFIQGVWTSNKDSQIYKEEMYLIELFIEDTFDNQKWMSAHKEIWGQELRQQELFVIVQDAEILA